MIFVGTPKPSIQASAKPNIDAVDAEIQAIQKRMRRFLETGDVKRLMRLKIRLAQLQADLDLLRKKENLEDAAKDLALYVEASPPKFRRSYSYDFFLERLHKLFIDAVK